MIAREHVCYRRGRGRSFRLRGLRVFLSSSAPIHVRQKQAQSSAVPVPVTATVQTCVLKCKESVVMGSVAVSGSCALASLPEAHIRCRCCWRGACVSKHRHTCVLQKQRVRGHASACGDILIERAQLPVCWTNVCSTLGS